MAVELGNHRLSEPLNRTGHRGPAWYEYKVQSPGRCDEELSQSYVGILDRSGKQKVEKISELSRLGEGARGSLALAAPLTGRVHLTISPTKP